MSIVLNQYYPGGIAQQLADQDASVGSNIFNGKSMAFVGDSYTARGVSITSTITIDYNLGYSYWAKQLSNNRLWSPPSYNVGVNGSATAAMLSTYLPQALALNPSVVVIMGGRNDTQNSSIAVGPDTTPGTITYNLRQMYNMCQAQGAIVIAVKILSHTFAQWNGAANQLKAIQVNRWIDQQKLLRNGFYVVDTSDVYDDPTASHWQPKTNYVDSGDNVHSTLWGAYQVGNKIATVINTLFPDWRLTMRNVDDVYDATNNPSGNLLPNVQFAGTGGTLSGGPTGSIATGWTALGQSLLGSAMACSKSTYTDGRVSQVVTISGSANGSLGKAQLEQDVTAANVNAGDTLEAQIDVSWGVTTNIAGVHMYLQTTESGTNYFSRVGQSAGLSQVGYALPSDNGSGSPALSSQSMTLVTPRRTLSAAPSAVKLWIWIEYLTPLSTATVAGTFTFGSPSVYKVPAASM